MSELEAVLSWFDKRMVRLNSDEGTWGNLRAYIAYFGNGSRTWFKVIVVEDGTLWIVDMSTMKRLEEKFKGHLHDPKLFEKVEDYLDGL